MAPLYSDEDVPFAVVERLRALGHDIRTAEGEGKANQGISDADQLAYATSLGRAILTRNRKHYRRLHRRFPNHMGIVSITFDKDHDGQATRVDAALSGLTSLDGQHVRVNRPSVPPKP